MKSLVLCLLTAFTLSRYPRHMRKASASAPVLPPKNHQLDCAQVRLSKNGSLERDTLAVRSRISTRCGCARATKRIDDAAWHCPN